MELAPFPCGRLPGFRRAISLHPSGCVLLCAREYTRVAGRDRIARSAARVTNPRRCSACGMAATSSDPLERLEAALGAGRARPRKRMLIIVNPYATTVSDRLKNLVVYALRGSYQVDAIDTEARDHATELCRRPPARATTSSSRSAATGPSTRPPTGSPAPTRRSRCLPGGRANVYCRMLGIPTDVVDATEHLLRLADDWRPRRVDLGAGQRPMLHVLGRRRARRERRRAGRCAPGLKARRRRVVLHVDAASARSTAAI